MTASVRIVWRQDPADWTSPEMNLLRDMVSAEAASVFGGVVDGEPTSDTNAWLLCEARPYVGRRSLARMHEALSASGAAVAVPLEVAAPPGYSPPLTLRGYEQIEKALLAGLPADRAVTAPVALVREDALAAIAGGDAIGRWRAGEWSVGPACSALGAPTAGICHPFGDYYGGVHADVLPFLPAAVNDVLEIGCGTGATGELLQQRLGCRVTGVELNAAAAEVARTRMHRVVTGDVMSLDIDGRFDAVVLFEVLEHVADPEALLRRVRGWLRPGGRIVMSLPNVGHHAIVEDLLAGRWDYVPMGLLCVTHLRFFTRRTITRLLERCGLPRIDIREQRHGGAVPPELARCAGADVDSLATSGFWVIAMAEDDGLAR